MSPYYPPSVYTQFSWIELFIADFSEQISEASQTYLAAADLSETLADPREKNECFKKQKSA